MDRALEKVLKIRGVYFDWDQEHGGKRDFGFIGEEVGRYFPEIVSYEEDGVYATGMDCGAMTPVLTEAIKELKAEKDAEIARLKAQNDALRQAICEIRPDLSLCK